MDRALVPIRLEAAWWLIEAGLIREILGVQSWLPVPRARAELPGVIVWRGRAIPVLDLMSVFGLTPLALGEQRPRTLIVEHAIGFCAIPVHEAREVQRVSETDLKEPRSLARPHATAELDWRGIVFSLLDLNALLVELGGRVGAEQRGR